MKLDDSMPPLWDINQFLQTHANDFAFQKIANEMDPNLILLRLGNPTSDITSGVFSSVQDGDTFIVNFNDKDFSHYSEVKYYSFKLGMT